MRHDGYIMVVAAIACENAKKRERENIFSLPRAPLKILISKVGRRSLVIPPFHSFSAATLSVPFAVLLAREKERVKYSA
jgi:hypothetical protein